jgi:hypothetical protein
MCHTPPCPPPLRFHAFISAGSPHYAISFAVASKLSASRITRPAATFARAAQRSFSDNQVELQCLPRRGFLRLTRAAESSRRLADFAELDGCFCR